MPKHSSLLKPNRPPNVGKMVISQPAILAGRRVKFRANPRTGYAAAAELLPRIAGCDIIGNLNDREPRVHDRYLSR